MFYAQAFKALFEYAESLPSGRLPIPVHVLCDDFATGSRILNFPEYISIFREKQISVTMLVQSESQLESMYGSDDATTIIQFSQALLEANELAVGKDHQFKGRYEAEKNAVIISLEKDERKC